MRQTLFYIPHDIGGLPVFGYGWVLIVWLLLSGGTLLRRGSGRRAPARH